MTMPIYEYTCEECQHVTEAERKMRNRRRAPKCEKCGGKTRLTISDSCTFALKGSGWASDNYGGAPKEKK